jgi:hypothetical protein
MKTKYTYPAPSQETPLTSEYVRATYWSKHSSFQLMDTGWDVYGITTVEALEHYLAREAFINVYRDVYGVRPYNMKYAEMSADDIEEEMDSVSAYGSAMLLQEEAEEAMRRHEEARQQEAADKAMSGGSGFSMAEIANLDKDLHDCQGDYRKANL